jgi:hypothetical protein
MKPGYSHIKTSTNLIKGVSLLILIVLILPACQKTELGKEIYFHIGEKQKLTSSLSFTVDSIWDSRCPTGLECVWSGDVTLFFNITHSYKRIDTLIECYPSPNVVPMDIAGYKWKVLEVNPCPDISHSIDPKDILIKMIITED